MNIAINIYTHAHTHTHTHTHKHTKIKGLCGLFIKINVMGVDKQ